MPRTPLVTVTLLFVTTSLAACSQLAPEPEPSDRIFSSCASEVLYLGPDRDRPLLVEVDVVEGFPDVDPLVNALLDELAHWRGTETGLELVLEDPLPGAATRGRSRAEVALAHMDATVPQGSRYLYVLLDDSERSGIATYNPHVRPEYRAAIFFDQAYLRQTTRGQPDAQLREAVLLHELGHVFGLVGSERGSKTHCPNADCLMATTLVPGRPVRRCDACQAELESLQTSVPGTQVRFHGPALVRSEARYWVASLPGYFEVVFRSPFEGDWRALLDRAREQDLRRDTLQHTLLFDAPEGFDLTAALEDLTQDPNPLAAEMGTQALELMAGR